MAGGLGTRLAELTRDTPKPMLKVGSRPLLETIVRGYADQGFQHFYFAVNYKSEQIEAHFGDGGALGIEVRYLREQQRLGTAGALSLLPERPTLPFIVTNADLLTKEDHCGMVDMHTASGADATMGVRPYEMQVPFGVVQECEGRITGIEEKPTQIFTVSAGMYVLSPQVLDLVPTGQFFDMPSLFDVMMREGLHTRCHRIDGYWLDIGQLPDYERAKVDFEKIFQ
jgi:NDP-sugar pyrophosphorylase family protein